MNILSFADGVNLPLSEFESLGHTFETADSQVVLLALLHSMSFMPDFDQLNIETKRVIDSTSFEINGKTFSWSVDDGLDETAICIDYEYN
ncbi:hypothetical protein OAL13_00015 [bacterium]|nr:hypothetical protein [bacterium]